MSLKKNQEPDHTAIRVALWRAIHAQIDVKPLVLEDEIGLQLIAPDERWKQRPDMIGPRDHLQLFVVYPFFKKSIRRIPVFFLAHAEKFHLNNSIFNYSR